MIVNGDCCLDEDVDGECDNQRVVAPPKTTPPVSAAVIAAPKEILPAEEITCDIEASTLSFLLRNTGNKSWELDSGLSWQHRGHIQVIGVYFNQYQMNSKSLPFRNGKPMFGPGPKFSSACTTPILSVGQETRCSFTNVPLAAPNYHNGTNEIRINIPNEARDTIVEFTCS